MYQIRLQLQSTSKRTTFQGKMIPCNHIEELLKQVKEIDLSIEKIDGIIKSHNEQLFLKSGKLKSGRMFHHSFYEHML